MDGEGLKLSCPNKCLAIMCIWCFCLIAVKCSIVPSVGRETRGKCWGVTGACARLPSVRRRPLIKVPPLPDRGNRTIVRTISSLLCSSGRRYLCWLMWVIGQMASVAGHFLAYCSLGKAGEREREEHSSINWVRIKLKAIIRH